MNIREYIQKLNIEKQELIDENKRLAGALHDATNTIETLKAVIEELKGKVDIEEVLDEQQEIVEPVEEPVEESTEEVEVKPKRRRKKDSDEEINLM